MTVQTDTPPVAPPAPPAPPGGPTPPAAPAGAPTGQQPPAADKGYPEGTRVEDMTAPQAVAYWREQAKTQQRLAEQVTKLGPKGLADLQTAADELAALTAASQTDQQRAVTEAEQRVRAEVVGQYAARLVDANITAAVAGRVPADVLAAQLAPVDRRWFLTADNDVDATKVAAYAEQLAGAQRPPNAPPNHGAGYRPGTAPVGADAGRAMAERRFGKRD